MNRKQLLPFMICLVFILFPAFADEDEPVVRAILFHRPNCPHCYHVIEKVLPSLMEQYGEQLQIGDADTHIVIGATCAWCLTSAATALP